MTFLFLNPANKLTNWISLSETITALFSYFGSFEKKVVLLCAWFSFSYLYMRICYKLRFRLQDPSTTMECQNKRAQVWCLYYKLYIKKRCRETKTKGESRLTSYIVLLNVQGFVDKMGFPRGLFLFKKSLLCFCFFVYFFGGEEGGRIFFTWQLQNVGETSVMRVKRR